MNHFNNTKNLTLTALMTALICILGPLSIPLPFSPIPISLTNLAIYFTIYILGMRRSVLSYALYLLIGFIGIPVFSSFTGGPGRLLGPTGGYLIGFLLMIVICGFFINKWHNRIWLCLVGMVLGTAACYLFGTLWLTYQADITFGAALAAGVLPFLLGDFIKIVIALLAGPMLRKRLKKADFI